MIFNLSVGAGSQLNFTVAVSQTEPADPVENLIWVNAASFSQWIFSPAEPSAPEEGLVWLKLKSSGGLSFNALKTNGITLYPGGCRQYSSGSWVSAAAKIYLGGSWTALED